MIRRAILIVLIFCAGLAGFEVLRNAMAGTIAGYFPHFESLHTASQIAPEDPVPHSLLAQFHLYDPDHIDLSLAKNESLEAVKLSPQDYRLWLIRAKVLEENREMQGAELCYEKAYLLAPNYFDTSWQWGDFLLRRGRFQEAVSHLQKALAVHPERTLTALELIWQVTDGDMSALTATIPQNEMAKLEMIRFLIDKGFETQAVASWSALEKKRRSERKDIFELLMKRLLDKKDYDLAWQVWSDGPEKEAQSPVKYQIQNSSFKNPITDNGPGFDWGFNDYSDAKIVRSDGPVQGSFSLNINYTSTSNSSFEHLKQLVLVQPNHKYRFRYSLKASDLVSLSLPIIELSNGERSSQAIYSFSVPPGSYDWRSLETVFSTDSDTRALWIYLRREPGCNGEPNCPIFGSFRVSQLLLERVD